MRKGLYLAFYAMCILAGLAGYFADTYLNVEYVGLQNTGPVITIIVIAFASAISMTAATMAFNAKKYVMAVLCSVGFVAAVCWSAPVSLSRISSSIDEKKVVTTNHMEKRKILISSLDEIKKLRALEAKKGGCGKNCRSLLEKENDLVQQIANLGLPQESNGGEKRIAYAIPFLSAETVNMVVPISAVVALILMMNGLLTFGVTSILDMLKKQEVKEVVVEKEVLKSENVLEGSSIIPANNDPIIKLIARDGQMTVSDVAEYTGKSLPYISTYVSDLEKRGLITKKRVGRRVFLTVTDA